MISIRRIAHLFACVLLSCSFACKAQTVLPVAAVQSPDHMADHRWVATWGTAQQMLATPPNAGEAKDRVRFALPTNFADQTVRMNLRTTIGGRSIRLKLSNASGNQPVRLDAVHVARSGGRPSEILRGSDRDVTFEGSSGVTIPPGVTLTSDPVNLELQPLSDLAVSIYARHETGLPTNHLVGSHTALIGKENQVTAPSVSKPVAQTTSYLWLAGIDVDSAVPAMAVVAFGDSITDGFGSTVDKEKSWPALLARRFQTANPSSAISVINEGISGNQVLQDGAGVSALARFDRDVLSQSGVRWMILLEGINDINLHTKITPDIPISTDDLTAGQVIAGYKQLIGRAHAQGIKVMGATLTPEEGIAIASVRGEQMRNEINAWIRTSGAFDAVADFDQVLRDDSHPARIRQGMDSDHIHPSDAGYQLMADAVPLAAFLTDPPGAGHVAATDELLPLPPSAEKLLRTDWANLGRYRTADEQLGGPNGRRVVFIGDSITDNWPKDPKSFFPGKDYVGRGISGQTTPQMLVRFKQDVIDLKPAVVVINGGTNDVAGNTGPSSLAMIEDNLAAMVQLARANRIKVVLASITPAAAYPWRPDIKPTESIVSLNRWMKEYCAGHGCSFADYFSAMSGPDLGMKPGISIDGVHPNAAGYAVMSPIAENAIRQATAASDERR